MIDLKKYCEQVVALGIKVCYISSNQGSQAIKEGVTNGD